MYSGPAQGKLWLINHELINKYLMNYILHQQDSQPAYPSGFIEKESSQRRMIQSKVMWPAERKFLPAVHHSLVKSIPHT